MKEITKMKWLFACLYFVQGGAISYFSIFQKPYLNQIGIERGTIGLLTSLLLLPFVLKVLFGYISDKYSIGNWGHRKPYMVGGLILSSSCFALAGFFPADKAFYFYAFLVLCSSFSVAFFDAATDGLAVDRIPDEEQGSVQSYMVAGKAIGVILLSISIGQIVGRFGYSFVFFSIAIVFLIPLFFTLNIKVTQEEVAQGPVDEAKSLDKRLMIFTALFAMAYSFISFGTDGLISLYLSDGFKLGEGDIGLYGSFRGLGAIVGAGICGYLFKKGKEEITYWLGLILLSLGVLLVGNLLNGSNYYFLGPLWGSIWGFQEVCFLTLAMRVVSHGGSAFGFALLMAMGNLGTAVGEGIITTLTKSFTYSTVFTIVAFFILIPMVLLKTLLGRVSHKKVMA